MISISKFLFAIFLLSMPIVGAFTIGSLISIPFLVSLPLIFFIPIMLKIRPVNIPNEVYAFFLFIIYVVFSYLVNTDSHYNAKAFNHFVSIVYAIMVFTMLIYYLNLFWNDSKYLARWILLGVFLSVLFGYVEYYSKYILGNVANIVPRSEFPDYYPIALGSFYRIRSFVSESGHYASYLISVGLISYSFFCSKRMSLKSLSLTGFSIVALLMTFSFSGIVLLVCAYFIYNLLFSSSSVTGFIKSISFSLIVILFALVLLEILFQFSYDKSFLFDFFAEKLVSVSAQDRLDRLNYSFNIYMNSGLFHNLFGLGPAYFYNYQILAPLSLYLTILFQYGIIGITLFLVPFFMLFYRVSKIQESKEKKIIIIALIYILLHFTSISNYWYPWLWFCVSFTLVYIIKGGLGEKNISHCS